MGGYREVLEAFSKVMDMIFCDTGLIDEVRLPQAVATDDRSRCFLSQWR